MPESEYKMRLKRLETITYRKIKNINKEKFANDLETAVTKIQHQNSLADKVERCLREACTSKNKDS